MEKFIRAAMAGMVLVGFGIGLAGCADESSVKTETQIKGAGWYNHGDRETDRQDEGEQSTSDSRG